MATNHVTAGCDVGKKLCEALGIQLKTWNDLSIKIDCHVDDTVRVTVERFVTKAECDALAEVLKDVTPVVVEKVTEV